MITSTMVHLDIEKRLVKKYDRKTWAINDTKKKTRSFRDVMPHSYRKGKLDREEDK